MTRGESRDESRDRVIAAALCLAAARMDTEIYPEAPHGDDHVDLRSVILDEALQKYADLYLTVG